jgi:hypothetical protein
MLSSVKTPILLGTLIAGAMLTAPAWAADQRSGSRGNPQPQAQPVSRQDAFFGQSQTRQDQFFAQPVFPQQPFNQNATILPPTFFAPMQLNYQGAPGGIIPGTGASFKPAFNNTNRGFPAGFNASSGITNVNVNSTSPTLVLPMITLPAPQQIQSSSTRQTAAQFMPRMGLLGRW